MNKFGGWEIKVSTTYPQKVASAISGLSETLIGCDYNAVAYLGSQQVNGTNHAVLAQQTVINGKDTKNVVVLVFNEKPGSMDISLIDIHRIVESGGELGGTAIDLKTEIPQEAKDAFEACNKGFVGSKVEPFAYVGTKVAKGTNHIFIATVEAVAPNAPKEVAIVTANTLEGKLGFERVFEPGSDDRLGYAFNW